MSKTRIKIPAVVVRTRAEMETLAGQIAALKIKGVRLSAEMDEALATVRARFAPSLGLCQDQIDTGMKAARAWAGANPDEFGKLKSIEMSQAVVGYRMGQPQLKTLKGGTWDRVLELVKKHLGTKWVRVKEEVDRAKILMDREVLAGQLPRVGLRIVQEETFFVEPKLTQTALRETVKA